MFSRLLHRMRTKSPDINMHRYPKNQGYVYDVEAFRNILTRECARSDRNGHAFSLAVLHLSVNDETQAASDAIVGLVGDRLRVTDQAGWLQSNIDLAILLYACSTEAARGFVERIRDDGPFPSLEYEVFAYPEAFPEWLAKGLLEATHA